MLCGSLQGVEMVTLDLLEGLHCGRVEWKYAKVTHISECVMTCGMSWRHV